MPQIFSILIPKDKKLFKHIFFLAGPVIISNLSRVIMGIVDMAMVGHLGATALAAVGMAGMVTWTVMSLGIALRTATQAVVSRRVGQKKYDQCGIALRNMHIFAFLIGIPISILCFYLTPSIISFFIKDSETLILCIDYAKFNFLGVYFMYGSFIFQGFYTGIEKTKIHMKAVITSNILNLYLNVGLIFGTESIINTLEGTQFYFLSHLWSFYEFPMLGVKGAAIGTLIATIWLFIHYFLYLFNSDIISKYEVFKMKLSKVLFKRQLTIGYPIAIQETLVMFSFTFFYKILGLIGVLELAATQVIFRIMHASFMPALGVGQACSTLVGKFLGEGNPDQAEQSIYESLRGSFYMMGSVGICFILFSHPIITLFTNDVDVIRIAVPGLKFVGLLQFVDAICFTLWFALTGAGDTKVPAIVDILLHWVLFVPACYILGITFGLGFWGPWLAFGLHLTCFSVFIFSRFRLGYWKEIIV
jgi:putative MATE family efflux protein